MPALSHPPLHRCYAFLVQCYKESYKYDILCFTRGALVYLVYVGVSSSSLSLMEVMLPVKLIPLELIFVFRLLYLPTGLFSGCFYFRSCRVDNQFTRGHEQR